MYIGDKYYGQFTLSSFISSRSFHATGHCCLIEKDYYKILGVPKDASHDDIKKTFHSVLQSVFGIGDSSVRSELSGNVKLD